VHEWIGGSGLHNEEKEEDRRKLENGEIEEGKLQEEETLFFVTLLLAIRIT
jgi:hypothetical protein